MASTSLSQPKINRIKTLAAQGHSQHSIAKLTGNSRNTIDKYLMFDEARLAPLGHLKKHTSDLLHELLGSAMSLQAKVLMSLNGEDVDALSVGDKGKLMRDTTLALGVVYDKIRLQDGKSTSNNSHEIQLNVVHKDMLPPLVSSGTERQECLHNVTSEESSTITTAS